MFRSPFNTETTEQEIARLADAPVGSRAHLWSTLPVRNEHIEIGGVYKLPNDGDEHVIVAVVEITGPSHTDPATGLRKRDHTYRGLVVGGNSTTYPVGGYELSVCESELRRAEKINR